MSLTSVQGLAQPYVIVKLGSSVASNVAGIKTVKFGSVVKIWAACEAVVVGGNVMFDTTKGYPFSNGSDQYFVIEDKFILFTETPAP